MKISNNIACNVAPCVCPNGVTGGVFLGEGQKPKFPNKLYNIMFKIDYPWNYVLSSTSTMLYVIFHNRRRAFNQGLQTRENNKNHEAVGRVIFTILSLL